jgi:6-phosphogluconolactonase
MGCRSRVAVCALVALGALAVAAGPASAASRPGAIYTTTNAASDNSVLAFDRAGDGSLRPAGSFSTDGDGTGSGLGSQGAITLESRGHLLYAVNAGSNSIATFGVHRHGALHLRGATPSGGNEPVSLTVHGDLLYVLNADSGEVTGFTGARSGTLDPLASSTQPIAGSGPAEVAFSNGGDALVVTNKASNTIDTFAVDGQGRAEAAQSNPSEGDTPFGFQFDKRDHLIVSEAFGGAAGASALSSYTLSGGGLQTISPSVGDDQAAACWVQVSKDGRIAYTTNTGSGTISSYAVGHDGSLELLKKVSADTGAGSAPTDMALARSGRVLAALLPGTDSVVSLRVGGNGALHAIDQTGGVPASAVGLAAS